MLIKLSILLILWLFSFYPLFPELFSTWLENADNSHCLLVPFVSLYFLWQKKDELRQSKVSSSSLGLLLLLASMIIYIISFAGSVAVVSRSMIIVSLAGLILYVFGKEVFRIVAFPVFFLFFIVPFPQSIIQIISLPLQLFATQLSAAIIRWFSIPVYQQGNMLYFVQTQLEVAEACSGIRSIISLTMLSVIFAYMSEKGIGKKIVLLLSAIPIALVANIIRVSGTGVLAHFYGDQVARGFLHDFSGMAVFAFGFVVLYLEYLLLNKTERGVGG